MNFVITKGDSTVDYVKDLLRAINLYDEHDENSRDELRDLVCCISENSRLKSMPFVSELLYIASHKMRVFGYNNLNQFQEDPDDYARAIDLVKVDCILDSYKSENSHGWILDKTQKDILVFFNSLKCKRMLLSAPTSYGKTFLMREILYHNIKRYKNVVLVFPTIALLMENVSEMIQFVEANNLEHRIIKSIGTDLDIDGYNIFVYTPERVLQLLARYPEIKIDFFFYDEIYKIDEDFDTDDDSTPNENIYEADLLNTDRAKTFRIALYLLSKRVPEFYLAGPNLNSKNFGEGMKRYLEKYRVEMREISFEPTVRIAVEATRSILREEHRKAFKYLGIGDYDTRLKGNKPERIVGMANHIKNQKQGKALFYCMNPSKAGEYAEYLTSSEADYVITDPRLKSFIEHIYDTYNVNGSSRDWNLIRILKQGIGVHHGALPRYIQKEILSQFNKGNFKFLFCTSTIIEGVNTDAKNTIILNKRKGRKLLTAFDIKNIGGRAGLYHHNFIGRIYYMENGLLETLDSDSTKLNFVTFDDETLGDLDVDNADLADLSGVNRESKKQRTDIQSSYILPRHVFEKNRLLPY